MKALFTVLLVLAVTAAAQEPPASEGGEVSFEPIPYPDMEGLEDAVKEQLNEAYGSLRGWQRQKDAPAASVAASFGRLGQLLHVYELWDAAAASYRNAARLEPENLYWHYYLGHVYQKSGRFEKAVESYLRSLEIEPRNTSAYVHLGEVFQAQNRIDEAVAVLTKALELDPESLAAQAYLGEIAHARGEHQKAIELLSGVIARVPAANRLHYPLAMSYRALGEREKALEHLDQIGTVGIRVGDPLMDALGELATGERVHLLEGRKAFAAGHYGEAASAFRKALAADPRSARVRVNLGSALGQMGDVVGALEQYGAALTLDPANVTAHFNSGLLQVRQGELERAVLHFEAAIDAKFDDSESHRQLGLVLRRLGRLEEAHEHLREAATLAPREVNARLDEVVVLVDLKRHEDALERLENAHAMMPEEGLIAAALARMLANCPDPKLRDGGRALDLAQRVFEAQPSASHGITVAQALAELDRCGEAAEWLTKLIDGVAGEAPAEWVAAQREVVARYQAGPPCR